MSIFSLFSAKLPTNDFSYLLSCIAQGEPVSSVERYLDRREKKYGNTLLTHAIATGDYLAAKKLIVYVEDKPHAKLLRAADQFPSSQSTPLILAAKVAHNELAFLLLTSAQVASFINMTDYRGNTALHYAAMTRNNALISELIFRGAKIDMKNNACLTAAFIYAEQIQFDDLLYPYQILNEPHDVLRHLSDWNSHYSGTKNPNYSFLRWFLPAVLLNMNTVGLAELMKADEIYMYKFQIGVGFKPKLEQLKKNDFQSWLEYHFASNKPIVDNRIYRLARKKFIEYRNEKYDDLISEQLGNASQHNFALRKN